MHIKWFIYLFISTYVMDKIGCDKHILFTTSRCFLKSKLITNLECSNDNTTLSFKIDTVKEIEKCYGLSNINFYVFGNKHTIQLRKLRTEFCDALTVYKPRTLMSLVNQGIYGSINNFPKRCPFLTNTTYYMNNMKFDAKFLPNYLAEYNFTFNGRIYMNNVLTMVVEVIGSCCNIGNDCR
ncbi:uncharacterized protein LOC116804182 [Drosophila mojavensis]|uniref:uncharacterized protein LOC116804182 n=1 Tax=Drosophila mojavensis TaxID=7230 RepID=UPI0013EEA7AD|nr:uncharacterized protein LOC116804182 [Drosophila mojavensis]